MFNVIGCKSKYEIDEPYKLVKCTECEHTLNDLECVAGRMVYELVFVGVEA